MQAGTESSPEKVQDALARLHGLTSNSSVSLGDIVEVFGETSFAPILLILSLIIVSPLSGIPFLPTLFGSVIALISLQMLIGRKHLWLPGFLMRRTLKGRSLAKAVARLDGFARWIDGHTKSRLRFLVLPPLDILPKATCMMCGAVMPMLELVPFSSSLLAAAVALIATSFLVRDGLFALCAAGFIGCAALVPLAMISGF